VEDHRAEPVRGDQPAQQLAGAEEVFLAGELIQRGGPHPGGEGPGRGEVGGVARGEQVRRRRVVALLAHMPPLYRADRRPAEASA